MLRWRYRSLNVDLSAPKASPTDAMTGSLKGAFPTCLVPSWFKQQKCDVYVCCFLPWGDCLLRFELYWSCKRHSCVLIVCDCTVGIPECSDCDVIDVFQKEAAKLAPAGRLIAAQCFNWKIPVAILQPFVMLITRNFTYHLGTTIADVLGMNQTSYFTRFLSLLTSESQ